LLTDEQMSECQPGVVARPSGGSGAEDRHHHPTEGARDEGDAGAGAGPDVLLGDTEEGGRESRQHQTRAPGRTVGGAAHRSGCFLCHSQKSKEEEMTDSQPCTGDSLTTCSSSSAPCSHNLLPVQIFSLFMSQ